MEYKGEPREISTINFNNENSVLTFTDVEGHTFNGIATPEGKTVSGTVVHRTMRTQYLFTMSYTVPD